MRFLAVDDDVKQLNELVCAITEARPDAELLSFTNPEEAVKAAEQRIDIAFLDIKMPNMTGLELAIELRRANPDLRIVFVSAHDSFAIEAFAIHANGYLLKPIDKTSVEKEIEYISRHMLENRNIEVVTFGGFEVYVDGVMVGFNRKKAKELLAILVDRKGASISSAEAYGMLFEDMPFTVSGRSNFRNILSSMRKSLAKSGADDILSKEFNSIAILPESIDCDLYRFLAGNRSAIMQYQNNYMPSYSWAEYRNGELSFMKERSI